MKIKNNRLKTCLVAILLCSFFISLLNIQNVSGEDYQIFTIGEASSNIALTCVYEDLLYLANDTNILIYSLENQSLSDTIALGGSVSVTLLERKANELYLKISDGGTVKYRVYHLSNNTLMDEITDVGMTNFDGTLKNLIWLRSNGIDFWGWSYLTGSALVDGSYSTYKGYDSSNNVLFISHVTGKVVDDIGYTHRFYRLNTTDSSVASVTDTINLASPDFFSIANCFSADTVPAKLNEGTEYIYTATDDRYGYDTTSRNIQSLASGYDSYYSVYRQGIRERIDTDSDIIPITVTLSSSLQAVWLDLEDTVYTLRDDDANRIMVQPLTDAGTGSLSNVYLTYNTNIASQVIGVVTVNKYLDQDASLSTYIGYVRSTFRPIAEKIIGSTPMIVGSLPTSYTPTASMVFNSDTNIVAVFVQSGSNSLYVCPNLIEDEYIYASYGIEVIAQLYSVRNDDDEFLVFSVKFMLNDTSYTPLSGELCYFYIDGVYSSTTALSSSGKRTISYAVESPPTQLSFLTNMTDYNRKWFNITAYSPTIIDVSETETPIITLDIEDKTASNYLDVEMTIRRFTGELLTSAYFDTNPHIDISVQEYGVNDYYHEYNLDDVIVHNLGLLETSLSYTNPYSYVVTYTFDNSSQYTFMTNTTSSITASFTYNSVSGDIVVGGVVVIPSTTSTSPSDVPDVEPTVLYANLINWFPALLIVLAPTIAFLSIAISVNANSGTSLILMLIGLNLGVSLGNMVGILPFYLMVTMFLLDAIMFLFILKSGGGNGE